MPVPIAPGSSISLAQIQTEFGGANPIGIDEYYRSGTYVGSGVANSTGVLVPTSGVISFISFSGAVAAIPAIGWWHVRIMPNTVFGSTQSQGLFIMTHMKANANNIVWTMPFTTTPSASYIQRVNNTIGQTTWSNDANNFILGNPRFLSTDGSDKILAVGSSGFRQTMYLYNSAGTLQWASNTSPLASNTILAALKANGTVWILGRGPSTNAYIANISDTNGTTVNFRWGFGGGATVISFSKGSFFINPQETHVWAMGTATSSAPRWNCFQTNGTYVWGRTASVAYAGVINDGTDRTDSSNNIYGRSTSHLNIANNFVKIAGISPAVSYRRALSSPHPIYYLTSDIGGNVYVAIIQSLNTIITKVNSTGTSQWSRKLRSARTGSHEVSISSMSATPTELVISAYVRAATFDTAWQKWSYGNPVESHILRVPVDGANTGTYANLIYESNTTISTVTPATMTLSTNTSTNLNYTFATTANTASITANSAKSLAVTTI